MKKLLKDYDLFCDQDYYEMIETSIINGQFEQAFNQFKAMPKDNKRSFIVQMAETNNLPQSKIRFQSFLNILIK